jgi:hypothetical protein
MEKKSFMVYLLQVYCSFLDPLSRKKVVNKKKLMFCVRLKLPGHNPEQLFGFQMPGTQFLLVGNEDGVMCISLGGLWHSGAGVVC